MTNPWQAWLQTFAQTCNSATQSQNPLLTAYTQGWQQWCNATSNAWQTPSEFWQTVSAIQTARAQSISQFWQQQPQQFAALVNCQSIPQACGQLTQWCGNNAVQAVNLAVTTQAYRANLWRQWSRNLQPAQPQTFTAPTTTSLWTETGTTKAAPATPRPAQPATQPITPPAAKTATPQPAGKAVNTPAESTTATAPWHMQSHYPTQHITQSSAPAAAKPQPVAKPVTQQPAAAVTQHQEAMPLMNGTTGLSHPTTSSTANSVMRANGSTLTSAAAAARRSVVARRATGRRRSVPRTVR